MSSTMELAVIQIRTVPKIQPLVRTVSALLEVLKIQILTLQTTRERFTPDGLNLWTVKVTL